MDAPEKKSAETPEVQFMLHELENLRSFLQEDTNVDEHRLDVILLLISGAGAGIGLLAQAHVDTATLLGIMLFVCATLPVLTLPVFTDTVARDVSAVDYIRAVNRIREYFVHLDVSLRSYLLMPGKAPFPRYGGVSTNRRILAVINSASLAALPLIGRLLVFHESRPDGFAVSVALGTFAVLVVIHREFWRWRYRVATRDAERFGSSALAAAQRAIERDERRAQKRRTWLARLHRLYQRLARRALSSTVMPSDT